jgi:hypothetical protein
VRVTGNCNSYGNSCGTVEEPNAERESERGKIVLIQVDDVMIGVRTGSGSQLDQRGQHCLVQLLYRAECRCSAGSRLSGSLTRVTVIRRFRYAAVLLVVERVVAALVLDTIVALAAAQGEEHAQNDDQNDERHSHLFLRVIAARVAVDANCSKPKREEKVNIH